MSDLSDFLLARIAETEAAARVWSSADPIWTPHVLAECDAKRRIVINAMQPCLWVLRYLALPYSSHPDYRSEWAP